MKKYTSVADYLNDLDPRQRAQVEALRAIVMSADTQIKEIIKWNSPSYRYNETDCITFSLRKDKLNLLVHMGAIKKEDKSAEPIFMDPTGLLDWNSNIRATMTFEDLADISSKKKDIITVLKKWLTFL
jgi:uncharacterized protein YdhG (YjbR/CyaY superfamily)